MKDEKKTKKEGKPEEKKEDIITDDSTVGTLAVPIEEIENKFTSKKIAEKISEEKPEPKPTPKPKPKPSPPPVKKVENRNIPCILRFKRVTAKQAANVAKLFRKLKYTNYTIVHSKGHNEWDILVRFDNLDERDKFEKIINKLL